MGLGMINWIKIFANPTHQTKKKKKKKKKRRRGRKEKEDNSIQEIRLSWVESAG